MSPEHAELLVAMKADEMALVGWGIEAGHLERAADGWILFDGAPLAMCQDHAAAFLLNNPDVAAKVEAKLPRRGGSP
jgi:hypothetical protein